MSGQLGMWMPKQKDGKNWIVNYTITLDGEDHNQSRKFRVREDASDFVKQSKLTLSRDDRVSSSKFKISKLEQ